MHWFLLLVGNLLPRDPTKTTDCDNPGACFRVQGAIDEILSRRELSRRPPSTGTA